MGTRYLTAVKYQDDYKVAQYGHCDGHPRYAGIRLLKFLKLCNMNKFKKAVSECQWLSDEFLSKVGKIEGWRQIYPEINANGIKILFLILNGTSYLVDNLDFAKDSLYCEYAYVIDLDSNVFEIYLGYNIHPLSKEERFYFDGAFDGKYYPVRLIKSYKIDSLPDKNTFITECKQAEEDTCLKYPFS